MNTKRVSLDDIRHAIACIEAGGERPSVRRVQQEIRYDYAGVSQLMRRHRLTQTRMNRMVRVRRSGARLRRRQNPPTGQRARRGKPSKGAKRQKPRAGQLEPRNQWLERVQGPELIEPYKALAAALLDQAIRDVRSSSLHDRRSAWHWLRSNPDCADFCDWLSFDHGRLIETLEARRAGAT